MFLLASHYLPFKDKAVSSRETNINELGAPESLQREGMRMGGMSSNRHSQDLPFGRLLRMHRVAASLTQRELASRADMSVAAIRDLEQGRHRAPQPRTLDRLITVLAARVPQAEELRSGRDSTRDREIASGGQDGSVRLLLQILGPFEAWHMGGRQIRLGPSKQRAVLGLLALHANASVHREEIIDVLWADDPPSRAVDLVQEYVSRLRAALAPTDSKRQRRALLASAGASYRLQLQPSELDLLVFRQAVESADAASSAGHLAAACGLYERALSKWRGRPFADLDILRTSASAKLLLEQRIAVVVKYAAAAAAAGWHDKALPYLWELAASEQLDERVHAQLIIALAADGQQAAALRVYQDIRDRLDKELGILPGQDLAEAQIRVLRQDLGTGLDGRRRPPAGGRLINYAGDGHGLVGGQVVPRQLPPDAQYFYGRARELSALTAALTSSRAAHAGAVCVINGMPGVGKTRLAVRWAHQVAGEFPDGQLYIDLHGFDGCGQRMTSAEALRLIFDSFPVAPESVPPSLESRVSLYRSLMAGKRLLVVLDNAYDLRQVRLLLPGAEGCMVMITSRAQLTGLVAANGASLVKLDVPTDDDARSMLANLLGTSRIADGPVVTRQLARLCANLPLALSLVAARAISRPDFPLAGLAEEAAEVGSRLDAIDAPRTEGGVREAFSWSYQNLEPQTACIFRLLGVLGARPGRDVTSHDVAAAAGIPAARASAILRELSYLSLATEQSPGRFCLHELLACYAAELADREGRSNLTASRRAAGKSITIIR